MSSKSKIESFFKANPPVAKEAKLTLEQQWNEFLTVAVSKGYGLNQAYLLAEKFAKMEKIKYPTKSTFQKYWANVQGAAKTGENSLPANGAAASQDQAATSISAALFEQFTSFEKGLKALLKKEIPESVALQTIADLLLDPEKLKDFLKMLHAKIDAQEKLQNLATATGKRVEST